MFNTHHTITRPIFTYKGVNVDPAKMPVVTPTGLPQNYISTDVGPAHVQGYNTNTTYPSHFVIDSSTTCKIKRFIKVRYLIVPCFKVRYLIVPCFHSASSF